VADSALALSNYARVHPRTFCSSFSDENRFISVLFHLKLLNIGVLLRYVFFVM